MWGGGQLARFMSTLLNFLILLLPADLGAEESFDPFVFFESLQVYDETIIMESRSGIGKLPAGMNDSRENTTYGKRQIYSAGDYIRSQGGQHNCYWQIISIDGGVVTMRFYGHIRGLGFQDQWISTSGYRRRTRGRVGKSSALRSRESMTSPFASG